MNYETLYERIVKGEEKLALIGLGYVGMPIAVCKTCQGNWLQP